MLISRYVIFPLGKKIFSQHDNIYREENQFVKPCLASGNRPSFGETLESCGKYRGIKALALQY